MANITATKIVNFFKGNILARFVVPHVVVIENGMQTIHLHNTKKPPRRVKD